ncbi:hypothetical protein GCG54_00011472 [Colletotrichum gloeosporioides]|uniref:Aminodeoxychorismate lyase n=1 Tax=Colletotrichum gloeosporioides TaxID=474922 RepID=A0A8H4CSE2_COLGL|nr:uncharacterized protein GCG54_00011472 [Colletotrichum gloeosporioides]KAF3809276.1 hypothetical protein GCG54_00011472 [Colletotrichum gloeosporioides]
MANQFELFTSLRFDPGLLGIPKRRLANAGWNAKMTSPYYMLDLHRDRMLRAATHWNWTPAVETIAGETGLQNLADAVETFLAQHGKETPLRVKVLLTSDGKLSCEASPVPPVPLQNLFPERLPPPGSSKETSDPSEEPLMEVVVDNTETSQSEYTHFKTTKRAMYDTARDRARIAPTDRKEVLLVNSRDGTIMEGSLTTPWFWRNAGAVVKMEPLADGLLKGEYPDVSRHLGLPADCVLRNLAAEEEVKAGSLVDGEPCWISNGVRGFTFGKVRLSAA